jgi:hypothetical protein
MESSTRKIVVEEKLFLWRSDHKYLPGDNVVSSFSAFREGHKQSPFRIFFKTCGYYPPGSVPLKMGVRIPLHGEPVELNLNLPSFAAQLISYGLKNGWNYEAKKPLIIEDGLSVLASLGYETFDLKPF